MNDFFPMPLVNVPVDVVIDYWAAVHRADLLKLRLCDIVNPKMEDVDQLIRRMGNQMYCVITASGEMQGEFMLENFTGKSAQTHFSVHPDISHTRAIQITRDVSDDILASWRTADGKEPYLDSIFGITPITNRAACFFVRKSGFKKIGILPGGMRDRGKIVDAMITVKKHKRSD